MGCRSERDKARTERDQLQITHQEQLERARVEIGHLARQEAAVDLGAKLDQLEAVHQKALEVLKSEHHEAMVELEKEVQAQYLTKLSKAEARLQVTPPCISPHLPAEARLQAL